MSKKNIYENIIGLYNTNLDEGRVFLYENMGKLMRKNPLVRIQNNTYTDDDVRSEAFLLADKILLRTDIDEKKKVSKLWFLFNKGGGPLYNLLNKYSLESYTIDNISESSDFMYDIELDGMLEYILLNNEIINPIEGSILQHIKNGKGRYEIARLMKTSYQNVKTIIEDMNKKIKDFLLMLEEE